MAAVNEALCRLSEATATQSLAGGGSGGREVPWRLTVQSAAAAFALQKLRASVFFCTLRMRLSTNV